MNRVSVVWRSLGLLIVLLLPSAKAQTPQEIEEALSILESAGDSVSLEALRVSLEGLLGTELLLGNLAAEERYAQRLLTASCKVGDRLRAGVALYHLARVSEARGDLARATELLEKGIGELEGVAGTDDRLIQALMLLGATRSTLGDPGEALRAFQKLEEVSRRAGNRKALALALQFQASVVLIQGDRQAAETCVKKSLEIAASLEDRNVESQALTILGMSAALGGDHRGAIEHWQKLLRLTRLPISSLHAGEERKLEVIALNLLAHAHASLGEKAQAVQFANDAVTLADGDGMEAERALALDARSFVHFLAARMPEAEADTRASIELFERARTRLGPADLAKAGALDQHFVPYDRLLQILVRQARWDDALMAAELGRARAFADALEDREGQTSSLEDLLHTARGLGATLVEYSILHDPTSYLLPELDGSQAAPEQQLLILVVRSDGRLAPRLVNLASLQADRGGETLDRSVRLLLRHLENERPADEETRALLRDLYDVLLEPIADLLPASPESPVVVIPRGVLFLVPFPALLDRANRHLVQKHTLLTMPSIEALARLRRARTGERRAGGSAVVVGNPATFLAGLGALPYAEEEAREVAAQLGTAVLLGGRATEAAVVKALSEARIIHLAGHGLLDHGGGGTPGALALAPSSDGEDGLLTAAEIRGLKLKAELVVLSACRSGRGRISGDGVIGLSRSFLAAGATGVVMSLWRIDSRATAALMIDFHRRLPTSDPARALRDAMLAAIERNESPGNWGAFSYIGAPKATPILLSAP